MKICVYAICKNEEKNIKSWVESMSEADEIVVLDTGSTDESVKLLESLGVSVFQKEIKPWRFDVARNMSLDLCPKADLYVCTDLDERFEKGWRKTLEENYTPEYTRVKYTYNWSFREDGSVGTMFYLDKIHNGNYKWTHPVHEVLTPLKEEKFLPLDKIVLNHFQDTKKGRSSYLPLLELSVEESPDDDRNMHYLGREYMYYGQDEKAIKTLHRHLKMPKAVWKDERCASMRYIARCYKNMGYMEEALLWYHLAVREAPYLREPYVECAILEYELKNYPEALNLLEAALKIQEKPKTYINEEFAWNYLVYDLASVCAYYKGDKPLAKKYMAKALELNPNDERLLNNAKIINGDVDIKE